MRNIEPVFGRRTKIDQIGFQPKTQTLSVNRLHYGNLFGSFWTWQNRILSQKSHCLTRGGWPHSVDCSPQHPSGCKPSCSDVAHWDGTRHWFWMERVPVYPMVLVYHHSPNRWFYGVCLPEGTYHHFPMVFLWFSHKTTIFGVYPILRPMTEPWQASLAKQFFVCLKRARLPSVERISRMLKFCQWCLNSVYVCAYTYVDI